MTTKTGIFLVWGGMSFIDTWPNINSVCDLPGLFGGNFWCWGGFVGVHFYFLGGWWWWWWFGCYCFCCCCLFLLLWLFFFLLVVVVVLVGLLLTCSFWFVFCLAVSFLLLLFSCFLFLLVTSHPKEKTRPKFVFQCFGGPLSLFSLFCFCLLIFLVVSHFFLIGISRCCLFTWLR